MRMLGSPSGCANRKVRVKKKVVLFFCYVSLLGKNEKEIEKRDLCLQELLRRSH